MRRRRKVIEYILLSGELACLMPRLAVLTAAAEVRMDYDDAVFKQCQILEGHIGRDCDVEAAVTGKHRGMTAIELKTQRPLDVERNLGSVFRCRELPDDFELVGRNLLQPYHFEYGGDPTLVGIKRAGFLRLTWTR